MAVNLDVICFGPIYQGIGVGEVVHTLCGAQILWLHIIFSCYQVILMLKHGGKLVVGCLVGIHDITDHEIVLICIRQRRKGEVPFGNDNLLGFANLADDNIVNDLMTTYQFPVNGNIVKLDFKGGLLGHWAVWTQKAVMLLEEIKRYKQHPDDSTAKFLLSKAIAVTDSNAAFFDPAHAFHGCIPGLHEVLVRQGLMKGTWCLNPNEQLSPGQKEEIERIYNDYPDLNDDAFVRNFLRSK